MRISSPPVVSPCFYGIDMADEDELAAAHRSVEEMREHIGATIAPLPLARRDAVGDAAARRTRSAAPASRGSTRRACRTAAGAPKLRFEAGRRGSACGRSAPDEAIASRRCRVDATYAAAGVSLATADAIVDRLRAAVDSTRDARRRRRVRRLRRALRDRRAAPARRVDRLGRLEARARPPRGTAPLVRRRPRRALHQRRPHDRRRAALLPRLRRRQHDRPRAGRRARRGRGRRLPGGRLRDPRRRDGGAARHLPRGGARLLRHGRRPRRPRPT